MHKKLVEVIEIIGVIWLTLCAVGAMGVAYSRPDFISYWEGFSAGLMLTGVCGWAVSWAIAYILRG